MVGWTLRIGLLGCLLGSAGCTSLAPRDSAAWRADVVARTGQVVPFGASGEGRPAPGDDLVASELTQDAAVHLALAHSPRLRALLAELHVADAERRLAALPANPEIDLGVRWPLSGGASILDVGIVQNVLDLVLLPLRGRLADGGYEMARLRLTRDVVDLVSDTRLAWIDAVVTTMRAKQAGDVAETADLAAEYAKRLVAAGTMAGSEASSRQTWAADAAVEAAQADESATIARRRLAMVLGFTSLAELPPLPAALPELPTGNVAGEGATAGDPVDFAALATAKSLDLALADARLAHARQLGKLTRATPAGDHLGAGAAAERDGDWSVGPSLAFELPIVPGRQRARRDRDAGTLQRLQAERDDVAGRVLAAADMAGTRLAGARHLEAMLAERVQALAAADRQQTHQEYNAMLVSAFDLLQAHGRELAANQRVTAARGAYWRARVEADRLLAGSLSGAASLVDTAASPGGSAGSAPAAADSH